MARAAGIMVSGNCGEFQMEKAIERKGMQVFRLHKKSLLRGLD
jgi:hypothetical protein